MRTEIPHYVFDVQDADGHETTSHGLTLTYEGMLNCLGADRTDRLLRGLPDTSAAGWRWRILKVRMLPIPTQTITE